MFKALGNDTEGEGLNPGNCLIAVVAVAHDPRQAWYLGQPTTIGLLVDFDDESHKAI